MNKIKCLVVDDEPLAIELLKDHISKTYFLELAYATTNPLDALEKIRQESFDLIFLDIQMPELNGMDFLKILDKKAKVILTTAYSEYALESYDHEVLDYLLKPVSFDRFYKSVLKIVPEKITPVERESGNKKNNFFFIKSNGQQIKIFFDDLLIIESLRDYVSIKTVDKEHIILDNLKDLIEILPDQFMRIHRSFIINLDKIESVTGNQVGIFSQNIPIGETYRAAFQEWLKSKS